MHSIFNNSPYELCTKNEMINNNYIGVAKERKRRLVMNIIFYLKTYYQILMSIQMSMTIFKNDKVTIIITDDSKGTYGVVEKIKTLGIVEEVIYAETRGIIHERKLGEKISDFISISLLNTNQYSKYIKELTNKSYDEFVFYNHGIDTIGIYNILQNTNCNIKASYIEEGILSYNFNVQYGKVANVSYKIRKLRGKKNLQDVIEKFYCYYPVLYKGNLRTIQVPLITQKSDTALILRKIFNPQFDYKQKYIFFTSVYDFEGEKPIGEFELACKIANLVGKDNLIIKIHPRDTRTIYLDNGFCVDKNSDIPWEVIQLSADFSDKIFLTVNSGSVLAGSFMSEKPVKTYYMYKLCDVTNNSSCKKNTMDIENLIKNKEMKDVLANVFIADKLEDILDE